MPTHNGSLLVLLEAWKPPVHNNVQHPDHTADYHYHCSATYPVPPYLLPTHQWYQLHRQLFLPLLGNSPHRTAQFVAVTHRTQSGRANFSSDRPHHHHRRLLFVSVSALINFTTMVFNIGSSILRKLVKFGKIMAQVGIAVGVVAVAALYSYQSSLIYPATLNDGRGYCATPEEYDMQYELVNLKTPDGETLQCYSLLHDPSSPSYANKTVLILSPNAGNIGHALPIVSLFYTKFGYNVFIYSYRGYGKSTGSPSEAGLKIDAQTVMKYLTCENHQYSQSSIVLYGRSLGGAVAIYIASTMSASILGLILENTFLSIRKTVSHIFPLLKYLARFVHQHWDLESLVPTIPSDIPVLLMSARRDEIVPPGHMDKIFKLLKSTDKTFYSYKDSQHNDTVLQPLYWDRVHEFIKNKINPVGLWGRCIMYRLKS